VGWLVEVTPFGVTRVDRDGRSPSAPLERPVMIAAMGQEVVASGPEERPEPAPRRVGLRQVAPLDQVGEEPRDEVAGLFAIDTQTSGEGGERIPVIAAETF
jgi:hypothetical protein